ncbi:hypothetical protein [Streptomyces sp. NPDC001380]
MFCWAFLAVAVVGPVAASLDRHLPRNRSGASGSPADRTRAAVLHG